jgi:eukaryotic-like serine/threonine-protein kinase
MSTPTANRLAEEADRAERAGDLIAAAVALRNYLEQRPEDRPARLRFARVLIATGDRPAARQALAPFDLLEPDDPIGREATRKLAELDEAEGAVLSAAERWERILADDIDDPQARAHLAMLRPEISSPPVDASQTLVSPEGVEISRYRLLRELGRGATATVYLARDSALELDLALKVLHPQLVGSGRSDACRRFFAEARLAAAIRHPGVVAIYDVDEGARALAMEWVAGGTVRERLRSAGGALPRGELAATARSLLATLAYVHARGTVHGDLKPSNLLLRRPGEIVLADFGTAELTLEARALTTGGVPRGGSGVFSPPGGTPLYLAPEQFRGAPSSPATDLYAVGAILWEATCGRPLRSHAELMRGAQPQALPADARTQLAPGGPEWAELVLALLDPDPFVRVAALQETQ